MPTLGPVVVATRTDRPTLTPFPSATAFMYSQPTILAVSSPLPAQPVQPAGLSPACQARLDNAATVHDTNVAYVQRYYQPWIDYYQGIVNQAAANRDAVALSQAQSALDQINADLKAALADENHRYKKEIAAIKASC